MSGKVLVQLENPTTQRTDAVEALAAFLHKPIEGGVLDLGNIKLVKNNRGDAFYGVTKTKCSCPSAAYRPGQSCKHQRRCFPEAKATTKPTASEPLIKRGGFKPFDTMPGEEKARATPSFCMVDTTPDTTPREVAYHEMQMVREMWPMVEA